MIDREPLVLPPQFRGEDALRSLPSRDEEPSEVYLEAGAVVSIDAFGSAVLRTQVEFHARHRQTDVVVGPPSDSRARDIVLAALEADPPAHLEVWGSPAAPSAEAKRSTLIPAVSVQDSVGAEVEAAWLLHGANGRLRKPIRFLAAHLPALVDNALRWGSWSPIGAVVSAVHDKERDELQLVVCDLDLSLARRGGQAQILERLIQAAPEGSLQLLVEEAAARNLSARVTLASGLGRLRAEGTRWQQGSGSQVEGFAVGVVLPARP